MRASIERLVNGCRRGNNEMRRGWRNVKVALARLQRVLSSFSFSHLGQVAFTDFCLPHHGSVLVGFRNVGFKDAAAGVATFVVF
jgi:hypothetical protein